MICVAHDGHDVVEIVFAQWRTVHSDPRNKLVRRRQRLSCIGGGIDKSFAEVATSAIMNVNPADAVVSAALSGVSDGIL